MQNLKFLVVFVISQGLIMLVFYSINYPIKVNNQTNSTHFDNGCGEINSKIETKSIKFSLPFKL